MATSALNTSNTYWFETLRVRRGTLFYVLCLVTIASGYYLYWGLWKLKAYFIAWGLCLVIAIAMLLANHLRARRVLLDMLPVLVWYGYLAASALWSPSPGTTLFYVGAALVNPVAFLVSYAWARSTSEWSFSSFFELQAVLILPIVFWYLFTIGHMYDDKLGAVRTGFAASCLIALPFLIWRARKRPGIKSVVVLLAAFALILTSDSRSGLVVMPVLLFGALFFVGQSRLSFSRSTAAVFVLLGTLVLAVVSIPALRDAFLHSLGRFSSTSSQFSISSSILDEMARPAEGQVDIARRLQLFIALRSFLSHPLLGGGYQSTYAIISNQFGWEVSAHGLPSTLLGETGLVGTAIFIWMIVRFYRRIGSEASLGSPHEIGFVSTCKLTMFGLLLLGLFHQVDQGQPLFVLLGWAYAMPAPVSQRA
ncbi:MAG: O-antigen ligase family protein [Gemmatimonadota bacterium]|nr:O-antigen ligase family protein [Gemmatimonadota bacterium]